MLLLLIQQLLRYMLSQFHTYTIFHELDGGVVLLGDLAIRTFTSAAGRYQSLI